MYASLTPLTDCAKITHGLLPSLFFKLCPGYSVKALATNHYFIISAHKNPSEL